MVAQSIWGFHLSQGYSSVKMCTGFGKKRLFHLDVISILLKRF